MLRASVLALCLSSASCFSPAAVRPSIATLRLAPLCSRAAAPCAQADSAIVPDSPEPASKPSSLADNLDAVYRFSRPHTIRGTLLACFTGVGRALVESPSFLPMIPALLPKAILGVLALLLGNLFIVGINQIYDVRPACSTRALPTCQHAPRPPPCPARPGASALPWAHLTVTSQVEIDQINKPFLPVAAGRISPKMAWALVIGSGAFCRPSVRPVPPPSTRRAVCTCRGLRATRAMVHLLWRVQVRRAWRWSRRSSAR